MSNTELLERLRVIARGKPALGYPDKRLKLRVIAVSMIEEAVSRIASQQSEIERLQSELQRLTTRPEDSKVEPLKIASDGRPHDTEEVERPLPCSCGFEWSAEAHPYPHDICATAAGEYVVSCPHCRDSGPLKARPDWAISAWNEQRSNSKISTERAAIVAWLTGLKRETVPAIFALDTLAWAAEQIQYGAHLTPPAKEGE